MDYSNLETITISHTYVSHRYNNRYYFTNHKYIIKIIIFIFEKIHTLKLKYNKLIIYVQ